MAAAVRTSAVGGSSSGTGNRNATITPASGDLLVVYCCVAANTNDTPTCSDDNGSGTYDLIETMNFAISGVNYRMSVFIRTALMVNTTSTVVTVATGSNSSGAVHVLAITGVTRTGANAVRSSGSQNNQAAATAAPTLNQAALTLNPTLVAHGSADTTTTPPTNWTEIQDTNFANDTVALETAFRASGFTGTTITFGAASSTQFCSHAMELDTTVLLSQSASDDVNNLADARGVGYGNLHTDSFTLSDTAQVVLGYVLSASDNINNLADGTAQVVGIITSLADSLATLADANARLLGYLLALADTTAANWADAHQLLLAQRLALADNSFNAADAAVLQLDQLTLLADSFSLGDSESHLLAITLDFSDSIDSLADSVRFEQGLTLADAGPFVESATSTPANVVYLDPGGDAVQATGYFNVAGGSGTLNFDSTRQVVGIGSWKFDSGGDNSLTHATVNGVLTDGLGNNNRRISFYFRYDSVPETLTTIVRTLEAAGGPIFSLALLDRAGEVGLRLTTAVDSVDSVASLAPHEWHRISVAYTLPSADDLSVNVYFDSILVLTLANVSTGGLSPASNFRYGWIEQPGADRICWFDQIYLDDGGDLTDPGDIRSTAKLPATVNADNFDTTGGTGAVNERPVDLTNYRQQAATAQVHQNYTLQTASAGDVDISSKTIVGYMGWVIAKKSGFGATFGFTVNGVTTAIQLSTTPAFIKLPVTDAAYPSDPAGIGMRSTTSSNDTFLYECGVVVAFRETQSGHDAIALGYGLLTSDSFALTDDCVTQLYQHLTLFDSLDNLADSIILQLHEVTGEIVLELDDVLVLGDSVDFLLGELVEVSSTLILSDSVTAQLDHLVTFSDSILPADSESHVLGYEESVVDVLSLTDVEAHLLAYLLSFSETVSLADSLALSPGLALSDSVVAFLDEISLQLAHLSGFSDSFLLTDSVVIVLGYEERASDALLLADAETRQVGQLRAFADSLVVTDEVALGLGLLLADSVTTLTDAISTQFHQLLDFSDSLILADNASFQLGYEHQFSDSIDLTDSELHQLNQRLAFTDSINNLSDSLTLTLGAALNFTDSLTLTDSLQLGYGLFLADDTNLYMDDILTTAPQGPLRQVGVTDALQDLTDEVQLRLNYLLTVADDSATFDDSVLLQLGFLATLSDSYSLADSLAATLDYLQPLGDSLALSDVVQLRLGYEIPTSDTLQLSDLTALRLSYQLSTDDSILLADSIFLAAELRFTSSDLISLTDTEDATLGYCTSLSDSFVLNDSVQLRLGFELAIVDTISLSDTESTSLTYHLPLADNVALLADSVTLTPGLGLIISDNGPVFTESISLFSTGRLQLADALALADSLTKFSAGFIQFEDTLALTDSVAIDLRGPDLDEVLSDALQLADAVSLSLNDELRLELQLTDLVTLSDHYFDLRYPYTPSARRHIVVPSRTRVTRPVKRSGIIVPSSDRTTRVE